MASKGTETGESFTVAVQQDRTNIMRFASTTLDTFGDLKLKIVWIKCIHSYRDACHGQLYVYSSIRSLRSNARQLHVVYHR